MTRTHATDGQPPQKASVEDPESFSPIGNERLLAWQRRIGLAPRHGLGILRRAIVLTLLAWVPLVVWAMWAGRFWGEPAGESLLQHFAVNTRFLLAIPLLVISEIPMQVIVRPITRELAGCGFIAPGQRARYKEILSDLARWRDGWLPPVLMLALAIGWSILDAPNPHADASAWGIHGDGTPGFGLLWGAYVSRSIFLILLLLAFWRMLLITVLFFRIGRLDLELVPSHPDRMGGLYFLERLPAAWVLLTLTLSMVVCSHWAHNLLYHGQTLQALKWQALTFTVIWTLIALLPLLGLAPLMLKTRMRALVTYGDLVARQGRLVRQRWIEGIEVDDKEGLLDAPDIGCVADTSAIFETVVSMRPVPIGKRALLFILVPLAIPMLVVVMQQVPLLEQLGKLVKALV